MSPDQLDVIISALSRLGISTIDLLYMVTKWKRTDHEQLVKAVQEEGYRKLLLKVFQVKPGEFTKIIEQGQSRMKDLSVCPRFQTAGMVSLWPLLYI
jgi:hypothetical protein